MLNDEIKKKSQKKKLTKARKKKKEQWASNMKGEKMKVYNWKKRKI